MATAPQAECRTLMHMQVAPQTVVPVLRCIPEHWLPWYTEQLWEVSRIVAWPFPCCVCAGSSPSLIAPVWPPVLLVALLLPTLLSFHLTTGH